MFAMGKLIKPAVLTSALAVMSVPQSALAQQVYSGNFTALNGSGVSGTATLTLGSGPSEQGACTTSSCSLNVQIQATGLEAGHDHMGHIHGLVDSNNMPVASHTPTLAQDTDHDGYIELAEGATTYGPILVPLGNGGMVDPAMTSTIDLNQTFNLLDPSTYAPGFNITSLLGPNLNELNLREIVLHGMTVPPGPGAGTPGEVNGTNGFLAALPVASAELSAVPEPATWAMMLLGFGGIGLAVRRRKSLLPQLA